MAAAAASAAKFRCSRSRGGFRVQTLDSERARVRARTDRTALATRPIRKLCPRPAASLQMLKGPGSGSASVAGLGRAKVCE